MDGTDRAFQVIIDLALQRERYGREELEAPDELDEVEGFKDLMALRNQLTVIAAAARAAVAMTDGLIIDELGSDAARYGDSYIVVGKKKQRRVIDSQALWDFIDSFDQSPRDLFNTNAIRVTGLRAMAAKRYIDPDTIEATFFDTEWTDEKVLTVKPLERAPASMQSLSDGERRRK